MILMCDPIDDWPSGNDDDIIEEMMNDLTVWK